MSVSTQPVQVERQSKRLTVGTENRTVQGFELFSLVDSSIVVSLCEIEMTFSICDAIYEGHHGIVNLKERIREESREKERKWNEPD